MEPDPSDAGLAVRSLAGRWVVFATILGSALASVDATVVTIALPDIGRDLDASFAGAQWTVTGYTLTLAALILLSGAAGDRFGRRRVFVLGVVWFTAASVLCAASPTIEVLIGARVLQGVGGALLTPSSLAIIQAVFRPADRGAAVGTWAGFSGVAGAIAPLLGGWLLDVGGWRWIFLMNVPLAAAVVVIALRHIPETRDEGESGALDWAGAAATVVFLGAGTYAVIAAGSAGHATEITAGAVVTVLGLLAFVAIERRARQPLLPLGLFRLRLFCAANGVTFIVYAALGVFFFILVLQLEVVAGWAPLVAGASTIPVTVITLLFSRHSGALAQRIGPRLPMSAGPLVCAVGILLSLRTGTETSYLTDVLPAVVVFGIGLAIMVAPLTATAIGALPSAHAGLASGVNNAVARSASLLAIAAIPVVAGLTGRALEDPARFDDGFRLSAYVCAGLLVAGGVLAAAAIRRPEESPGFPVV